MNINDIPIDLSDIPELTKEEFARGTRNPYAKKSEKWVFNNNTLHP